MLLDYRRETKEIIDEIKAIDSQLAEARMAYKNKKSSKKDKIVIKHCAEQWKNRKEKLIDILKEREIEENGE